MNLHITCAFCSAYFTVEFDESLSEDEVIEASKDKDFNLIDDDWYCSDCSMVDGDKAKTYYELYWDEKEEKNKLKKELDELQKLFNHVSEEVLRLGRELKESTNRQWRFWS